jgi:hypothetical protein
VVGFILGLNRSALGFSFRSQLRWGLVCSSSIWNRDVNRGLYGDDLRLTRGHLMMGVASAQLWSDDYRLFRKVGFGDGESWAV